MVVIGNSFDPNAFFVLIGLSDQIDDLFLFLEKPAAFSLEGFVLDSGVISSSFTPLAIVACSSGGAITFFAAVSLIGAFGFETDFFLVDDLEGLAVRF